jgi:hypothetical protein
VQHVIALAASIIGLPSSVAAFGWLREEIGAARGPSYVKSLIRASTPTLLGLAEDLPQDAKKTRAQPERVLAD